VYLDTYLNPNNIIKDDGLTRATFHVIYAMPDYPLTREFNEKGNELLFCIGDPNSTPLLGHDQYAYGYEEHVPIEIISMDKDGCSGPKLQWKGEAEVRRIVETYPMGSLRNLERKSGSKQRLGSHVLHRSTFILKYRRDTT